MPRRPSTTAPIKVDPIRWYSHGGGIDEIAEIFVELGKKGMDIYSLRGGTLDACRDLSHRMDDWEDTLIPLLDFRYWDLGRLAQRDKRMAMPRIDIYIEVTSKDNLSMKWRPRDDRMFAENAENDFLAWNRSHLNDFQSFAQRPNNELLFVRGVGHLVRYDRADRWLRSMELRALYGTRLLCERIVRHLRRFCDTRVVTDFIFVLNSEREVVSWSVDDVARRWVKDFESAHGLTAYQMCQKILEYRDSNGVIDADKLSRALRKEGFASMTPKPVREIAGEFRNYIEWPGFQSAHRDIFEMWQSGNGNGNGGSAEIIPIR